VSSKIGHLKLPSQRNKKKKILKRVRKKHSGAYRTPSNDPMYTLQVSGILDKRKKRKESLFKEIMTENDSNLEKMNIQMIHETERTSNRLTIKRTSQTYITIKV
jgi:hypothetical protein